MREQLSQTRNPIGKPKTAKEELRLTQERGRSMVQGRDKPLDDLTETKDILRITEITSKIYEIEYKSGRQELSRGENRLRATRAANHRGSLDK